MTIFFEFEFEIRRGKRLGEKEREGEKREGKEGGRVGGRKETIKIIGKSLIIILHHKYWQDTSSTI